MVRNGRCEYRYVLGLLVYGKVVVDFGRKVFFADCLAWKTFNMARINRTERTHALPCTQKIVVRIPGNMNAMRHPNDVIRSVLLPHIRFNREMMLAKDNTPYHADRSTQVILVTHKRRTLQWPAQSMDLNPSKYVWDILKRNVRAQPL